MTADGGVALDADRLLSHVAAAIDGVARDLQHDIAAVGIAAFWHSLVGVDADGRPLTPLLPWSDVRAADGARALRTELDERAVHARTGCRLHQSYWPARLRWYRARDRRLFRAVARWISFTELLERRWLGRRGVSVSQASGTGLLNQATCAWDCPLLEACHLDDRRLSPVVDLDEPGRLIRAMARRWPRLAEARWVPAAGDGALNNVGAGCTRRSRAAVMIGTSGAIRVLWRSRRGERIRVPFGLWRYRLDRRRPIVGGALSNGGNVREWLLRMLAGRQDDPEIARDRQQALQRLADRLAPDAHGLTILPFLGGTRSPDYLVDARGVVAGLTLATSQADLLRAGMEAIAFRFAEVFAELLRVGRPDEIVAAGGGLERSAAWTQIVADVLERPVRLCAAAELTSRGAAAIAFEQLGLLDLESLEPPGGHVVDPDAARSRIYRAARRRQSELLRRMAGVSGESL